MKRSFNFALINTKEIHKLTDDWAKQMMLTDRGFSPEILQEFMIGFAPDERSFVSTPLINNSL
jgi:DNA primase